MIEIWEKDMWQVDIENDVLDVEENVSICMANNDWSMYCEEELGSCIHYQQCIWLVYDVCTISHS